MGLSPDHASTVPLVLNLDTGAITPQFHVVFDDWFTTVATSVDDIPDFNSPARSKMFGYSEYQFIRDEDDTLVDQEDSLTSEDITTRKSRVAKAMENTMPPTPLPVLHYLPHLPTYPPCALFSLGTQIYSSCCVFIFKMCITPSLVLEGENTLASAPVTEGAPRGSTEGAILSTSLMIPHANKDPC